MWFRNLASLSRILAQLLVSGAVLSSYLLRIYCLNGISLWDIIIKTPVTDSRKCFLATTFRPTYLGLLQVYIEKETNSFLTYIIFDVCVCGCVRICVCVRVRLCDCAHVWLCVCGLCVSVTVRMRDSANVCIQFFFLMRVSSLSENFYLYFISFFVFLFFIFISFINFAWMSEQGLFMLSAAKTARKSISARHQERQDNVWRSTGNT